MKIKTKLILMVTVSLSILALSIVWISNWLTTDALEYRIENTLEIAVDGYTDDVYAYKEHGVDITVFEGDTRVASSITGAVGTKASQEIVDIVNKERVYFDDNVDVNGERFYGYYRKTDDGMIFAGRDYNELHSTLAKVSYVLIVVSVLFVIASVIATLFIASKIAKPIVEVNDGIKDIANGDLTVRFVDTKTEKESKDEIVNMKKSMNNMTERLRDIIGNVKGISNDVSKAMDNLSEGSDAVSKSTFDIASAVSEVSNGAVSTAEDTQNAMENVNSIEENINGIKENTESLSESAKNMNNAKDRVISILDEFVKVNESMSKTMKDTNTQINITNENVREIQKFIEVIKDIANQTNLLSLNAQIEASHAGDFGKGFAVVAGEIRKLAEQSANASTEIASTLNNLLGNYDLIIQKMNVTNENIVSQDTKLIETRENFDILGDDINITVEKIKDINAMVKKLNLLRNNLVDIISSLSAVSEENAASAEETTASIQELTSVINQMCEEINDVKDKANVLLDNINVFTV